MNEPFVVFAGHFPEGGGWDDFHSRYATLEEARALVRSLEDNYGWTQIVNVLTGEIDLEEC